MERVADLARQLNAAFEQELPDRVGALERGLLALEEADGAATATRAFADLYAAAYNLQGAARVVELADLAHLAGALAAALDAARQPDMPLAVAWFAAARRAVAFLPTLAAAGRRGERPDAFFDALADLAAPPDTAAAPTPALPVVSEPAPAPALAQGQAGESVRVNVGKLDTLLAQTGELAVTRIRVGQRLAELTALRDALGDWQREWRASRRGRAALRRQLDSLVGESGLVRELSTLLRAAERAEARAHEFGQQVADLSARLRGDVAQLGLVAEGLADEVLAARLLPVASAFGPLERLVRDLSREQGKAIDLALAGGETEIDRKILERLRDPLMHMLRNAVDHGIESPEARAAGKPATGHIRLAVANRGGAIEIALADDGAGLDAARLRATAIRKGLLTAERAEALDEEAAFGLIFQPGFSTTPVATATSGRGVGMDVVRDEVARLGGHIRIASAPGQGATFTITVPLTLATTRAILVEQAGRTFAIPSAPIERTARVRTGALVALEGRRAVLVEGRPVPVAELADLLQLPPAGSPPDPRAWRSFIVLRQDERRVALLVDRLTGEQELVIKPLGWPLRRVRNVGGAAVLGSGETVPILNPADLLQGGLRLARVGTGSGVVAGHERPGATPSRRRRVLVVDDSLTTRMLERGILEAAGYETIVAGDGAEALGLLAREAVDLVISDVEMPNLDGFGLTVAIRRDERLRHLPVVLVTSLDDPEHRERGVSAGADAYLGKKTFDQGQLLDTIGRLL